MTDLLTYCDLCLYGRQHNCDIREYYDQLCKVAAKKGAVLIVARVVSVEEVRVLPYWCKAVDLVDSS